MALKDTWVDRVDGVDDASAEDINEVAHAVIDLEENQLEEIIVDSEMSDTSTNPVQNNVIKSYIDEQNTDKWDELVNVTLTENLATEFRQVFEKKYKRLRFKIIFKGKTSLTTVRFKRGKTDGGNSPTANNYLKYSSGNTSTPRHLSATVSYDLDGRIILTNGAETNGTSGFGDKGGATFGGDVSYLEKYRTFPEFFFYLGGSIAEDGTLTGNVLGKGTTIQVWGCE
jgi:hypothetical protein